MTKLEQALELAERGFKVFPIRINMKKPAHTGWQDEATTDIATIRKWFSKVNFNIGILTTGLLVVDVDSKDDRNGFESIEKLKKDSKLFPTTTTQVTPSGGKHFIYKATRPVGNSVSKIGDGLDIRGEGGYIVAAGSSVPSGVYEMDDSQLIEAPAWLADACEAKRIKRQSINVAVDQDRAERVAREYLEALDPVGEGRRNDAAFRAAAKLKDIGLEKANCEMLMLAAWDCSPMLDVVELRAAIDSAYDREGYGSDSVEAKFADEVEEIESDNVHPVLEMNKDYAFAVVGGGHRILHEYVEDGHFMVNYLKEETFHKKLAHLNYDDGGNGQRKKLTQVWVADPRRRSYDKVVFDPSGHAPPTSYNLWRGFGVTEILPSDIITDQMKKAVDDFKEHIFENVCDMDSDHYNWILGWMAHMVQKPHIIPEVALVLRGNKGVGKNIISDTLGSFCPENYMITAEDRFLLGNFNAHREKLLLMTLDEAFWSGNKEAEGKLKSLITGKTVNIERKGCEVMTLDSCLRLMILSNERWVIPASDDERRYAVFNVGDRRRQDRKFFGSIVEGMKAGGIRLLFTELKKFDLKKVDPHSAPNTEGLQEQKQNSLSPLEQWWFDSLFQGYITGISDFSSESSGWETRTDRDSLKNAYVSSLNGRHIKTWIAPDHTFVKDLKLLAPTISVQKSPTSQSVDVILPSLEDCRTMWDDKKQHKTLWGEY